MIYYFKNNIYNILYIFLKLQNNNLNIKNNFVLINTNESFLLNDYIYLSNYNIYSLNFFNFLKKIITNLNVYRLTYQELNNLILFYLQKHINLTLTNSQVTSDDNIIDLFPFFIKKYNLPINITSIYNDDKSSSKKVIILNNDPDIYWFKNYKNYYFNLIIKDIYLLTLNNDEVRIMRNYEKSHKKYSNTQLFLIFYCISLIIFIIFIKIKLTFKNGII
jgi:hypothetical protein